MMVSEPEDNSTDKPTMNIDSIEFYKDTEHPPQVPNQDEFQTAKESLQRDEVINFPITIHAGERNLTFDNGVTFSLSDYPYRNIDNSVDYSMTPMVLCINRNDSLFNNDEDDLGNDEFDYISKLDSHSSYLLKCMIAYETIDLSNLPLGQHVKICFDDELDTPQIINTTISEIIYVGKYRTRKGRLANPSKSVTFINGSCPEADERNRRFEDQRDRMKHELSYFIEHTDDNSQLASLDGLIYKYHYIIHDLDKIPTYRRMDEAIDMIKRLRSYPLEMGDDQQHPDNSIAVYRAYVRYGISILDGFDFSRATFF